MNSNNIIVTGNIRRNKKIDTKAAKTVGETKYIVIDDLSDLTDDEKKAIFDVKKVSDITDKKKNGITITDKIDGILPSYKIMNIGDDNSELGKATYVLGLGGETDGNS